MSYFREAERPKRRYPLSDADDVSEPDDDETEDDEPWNQGRRARVSHRHVEVIGNDINDIEDLVFGSKSWLAEPVNGLGDRLRSRKRRADGNARRWFFKKDGGLEPKSQVDKAVALRQNGLELSNAEDVLEQEDDDVEDMDDLDDGLENASPV